MHVVYTMFLRQGERIMVNNLQMQDAQYGLSNFLGKRPVDNFSHLDDFQEPKND